MKAAVIVLALASTAVAVPSTKRPGQPAKQHNSHLLTRDNSSSSSTAGTKVILDNDWSTAGFIPYLMALDAGWDVLGLIGDTSDSWALQTSLHGLATLEVGNLSSCIPVYKGSDYPLINTPELFQTWEDLHGDLAWVSKYTFIYIYRNFFYPISFSSSSYLYSFLTTQFIFSKVPLPSRTPRWRQKAMTRHRAIRRGSSRRPSTRATPTARWPATIRPPGWSSRSASTPAR